MKRILTLVGAFVGVGLLGILFGFVSQMGKTKALRAEVQACNDSAAAAARDAEETATLTLGILELYRARAELARDNFGSAGDALGRAKQRLAGDAFSDVRKAIEETGPKVINRQAAASDDIAAIIKTLEAKPKAP